MIRVKGHAVPPMLGMAVVPHGPLRIAKREVAGVEGRLDVGVGLEGRLDVGQERGGTSVWWMTSGLATGISHATRTVVTPDLSPPHLAPVVVLATPEMIWLMEQACTEACQPLLEPLDQTTVGTHVDVSHESAARLDEEVVVTAELVAVDGPRLTFRVDARVEDRVVGRGIHRRHVIDRSRFAGP